MKEWEARRKPVRVDGMYGSQAEDQVEADGKCGTHTKHQVREYRRGHRPTFGLEGREIKCGSQKSLLVRRERMFGTPAEDLDGADRRCGMRTARLFAEAWFGR